MCKIVNTTSQKHKNDIEQQLIKEQNYFEVATGRNKEECKLVIAGLKEELRCM